MLCLSGFELYSGWVPLILKSLTAERISGSKKSVLTSENSRDGF